MKKLLFKLFILSNIIQSIFGVACPDGATKVEVNLPSDGSTVAFCQKNFRGNLLKHGPYKRTSSDGLVVKETYYNQGKEGKKPSVAKTMEKKSPCETFKRDIRLFLNPMVNKEEGTHRKVVTNPELCPGYPLERLAFMVRGTPFNMTMKYKKRCHMKGTMKWVANKKGHARFESRPPFTVDSFEFDYVITRGGEGAQRFLDIKVNNGIMKKKGKEGSVKFSVGQRIRANLIDLKTSKGREGLFTEEPNLTLTEAFGEKC